MGIEGAGGAFDFDAAFVRGRRAEHADCQAADSGEVRVAVTALAGGAVRLQWADHD